MHQTRRVGFGVPAIVLACLSILVLMLPSVAVAADTTGPVSQLTAPTLSTDLSASTAIAVKWNASDASGVKNYDVQYKVGTGAGAWSAWKSATTLKSASFGGAFGTTYCFRVRARDIYNNVGLWSAPGITTVPYDDSRATYSSGWATGSGSGHFRGTYHSSATLGKTVTFAFTGKEFKLIGLRKPTTGRIMVYLDGSSTAAGTIDTKAATTLYRQVLYTKTWSAVGYHKVKVKVLATPGRPRVYVDGFALRTFDATKPSVVAPGNAVVRADASRGVDALITDNVGVAKATLSYRLAGATAYTTVGMSPTGSDKWRGILSGTTLSNKAVQYFITAKDFAGNVTSSSVYTLTPVNRITISPGSAMISKTASKTFTATAWTKSNAAVPGVKAMWVVASGPGSISSAGLFTPSGVGLSTVGANFLGLTASAKVSAVTMVNGTLGGNTTWSANQSPYVVDVLTVPAGVTLSIPAGTIVKFLRGSSGMAVYGTLDVNGNASDKVTFTSLKDDSAAGDTNCDGAATSAAAGNWDNIRIAKDGAVDAQYAAVKYGASSWTGVDSGTFGVIHAENGSSLALKACQVATNLFGVHAETPLALTLTDNSFESNRDGAAWVSYPPDGMVLSGNSFTGGKYAGVRLEGDFRGSVNMPAEGVYTLDGITIPTGITVTFQGSPILKVRPSRDIIVGGTLVASGTEADPAVFTSIKDDTWGGDTNGDGAGSTPAPGAWDNIYVPSGGTLNLDNAVVSYGGSSWSLGGYGVIHGEGGSALAVTNSAITHNAFGLRADNTLSLTMSQCEFEQNQSGCAWVTTPPEGSVLTGNTFNGKYNGIKLEGDIHGSLTLPGAGKVYIFGDLNVPSGSLLTLQSGAIVKVESGRSATVSGTMNLAGSGTGADRVYLTSIKDDIGGDTNGSTDAAAPGDWASVTVYDNGKLNANYSVIRYGGSNFEYYSDSAYYAAIDCNPGSSLAASNCDFVNNLGAVSSDPVYQGGTYWAVATECYWGDAAGPTYAGHPGGDKISFHLEDRNGDFIDEVYADVVYTNYRATPLP